MQGSLPVNFISLLAIGCRLLVFSTYLCILIVGILTLSMHKSSEYILHFHTKEDCREAIDFVNLLFKNKIYCFPEKEVRAIRYSQSVLLFAIMRMYF